MELTRPAVMMPPSECPQAMIRLGLPNLALKVASIATWSRKASARAQPVLL